MTTSTTNDGVELEYHGRRGEGFEHEKRVCSSATHLGGAHGKGCRLMSARRPARPFVPAPPVLRARTAAELSLSAPRTTRRPYPPAPLHTGVSSRASAAFNPLRGGACPCEKGHPTP
jgi:hypothetical protein